MEEYLLSTGAITLGFPEATATLALLGAAEGAPPARLSQPLPSPAQTWTVVSIT